MSVFKVGDRVCIRNWDDMEKEFGLDKSGDIKVKYCFTKDMRHLCGRMATIISITKSDYGYGDKYKLDFDDKSGDTNWNFSEGMFVIETRCGFKKGDVICVLPWNEMVDKFGVAKDNTAILCPFSFTQEMERYSSRLGTIVGFKYDKKISGGENLYKILNIKFCDSTLNDGTWTFTTDMVEKV